MLSLNKHTINTKIQDRYATVVYSFDFENINQNGSSELKFEITIATEAFISRFEANIDGELFVGQTKEKVTASKEYSEAKEKDKNGILISRPYDDIPNVFEIKINTNSKSKISLDITIEQYIQKRFKFNQLNIQILRNFNKYNILQNFEYVLFKVDIHDQSGIYNVMIPSSSIIHNQTMDQWNRHYHSNGTITNKTSINQMIIKYKTKGEQNESMVLYDDKTRTFCHIISDIISDSMIQNEEYIKEGHHDSINQHILIPRRIVFVIDTSGSMAGGKWNRAISATVTALKQLRKSYDRYCIVFFNQNNQIIPDERIILAIDSNIHKTISDLQCISPFGGKNINNALMAAIDVIKNDIKRSNTSKEHHYNFFMNQILLITDGEPSSGELNPNKIISNVKDANDLTSMDKYMSKISIFSFGVATDTNDLNHSFLNLLSINNNGFYKRIKHSNMDTALTQYFTILSAPVLSNIKIRYKNKNIHQITNTTFHALYAGNDIIICGKIGDNYAPNQKQMCLDLTITATTGKHIKKVYGRMMTVPIDISKEMSIHINKAQENHSIERIWSYLRLQECAANKLIYNDDKHNDVLALSLAMKYKFVTPWTSMIVVKKKDMMHSYPTPIHSNQGPNQETLDRLRTMKRQMSSGMYDSTDHDVPPPPPPSSKHPSYKRKKRKHRQKAKQSHPEQPIRQLLKNRGMSAPQVNGFMNNNNMNPYKPYNQQMQRMQNIYPNQYFMQNNLNQNFIQKAPGYNMNRFRPPLQPIYYPGQPLGAPNTYNVVPPPPMSTSPTGELIPKKRKKRKKKKHRDNDHKRRKHRHKKHSKKLKRSKSRDKDGKRKKRSSKSVSPPPPPPPSGQMSIDQNETSSSSSDPMNENDDYKAVHDTEKSQFTRRRPISSVPMNIQKKLHGIKDDKLSSHLKLIHNKDPTKTDSARKFLKECLLKEILFQAMDTKQINEIVDVMYCVHCPKGEYIIRQNEYGDAYFIIQSGAFDIILKTKKKQQIVGQMLPGKAFGEGSLLYSTPCVATVKATKACVVWALDSTKFLEIRQAISQQDNDKTSKIVRYLRKIELFKKYNKQDLMAIGEAVIERKYTKNARIIQQGDEATEFFIIKTGAAIAVLKTPDGKEETVKKYCDGDFFGERGIYKNDKRAASIIATSTLRCYVIAAEDFTKLLANPLSKQFDEMIKKYDDIAFDNGIKRPFQNLIDCKLADFIMLGILGVGAFGRVSLVKDPKTSVTYSLKKIRKNKVIETGQQEHVRNERAVLSSLDSDFCVKLYGTYQDELNIYFLMEPVLGGELFAVLRWNKRFSEKTARFYAACVVLAFESLHEKNILYRDLKPENLLIAKNGYCKLVDFGFGKKRNNSCTLCGTPEYISPEVIQNTSQGFGVDWWALGIFIYEMVVGNVPFRDDANAKMYEKILIHDVQFDDDAKLTPRVQHLIFGLLEKEVTQRLGSGINGTAQVMDQPWFQGLNWDEMRAQKIEAPYVPDIKSNDDLNNYDDYPEENIVETLNPDVSVYEWCEDF